MAQHIEFDRDQVVNAFRKTPEEQRQEAERAAAAVAEADERGHWAEVDAENRERIAEEYADEDARRKRGQRNLTVALADEADALAGQCTEAMRGHLDRSRNLPGQQRSDARVRAIKSMERAGQYRQIAQELRASITVTEPDVYGPTSPHSWFADLATIAGPDVAHTDGRANGTRAEAEARLQRYGRQVADDSRRDTAEGRYARRALREVTRRAADLRDKAEAEYRAMTSGAGSGGAFVAPFYVTEDYATFRAATPSFLEHAVTQRPLPDYGLTVDVPAFTGPSGAAKQTSENVMPAEVDPTATYRSAPVSTFAGVITASQQLADRAGPTGIDSALYAQLREDADAALDLAVITAALSGLTPLTRATFGIPGLLSDIGQLASALTSTAGVSLPPTALVTQPVLGEWLLSQVGSDNRPIFLPAPGAGTRSDGFLGYSPSGIALYGDNNIPASSGDAQIVCTNAAATFVYAGEPVVQALPDTSAASNLSVLFRLYRYAAPVVRYPGGTAVATGAAYPLAPTWA